MFGATLSLKSKGWSGKMIPGPLMMGRREPTLNFVILPPYLHCAVCTHAHILPRQINKYNNLFKAEKGWSWSNYNLKKERLSFIIHYYLFCQNFPDLQ